MSRLSAAWQAIPPQIRKPIVFVVGLFFVLAAAATGWLPGPGGIPLFLIGIAILATEYAWAARVRDGVLSRLETVGSWIGRHSQIGSFLLALGICTGISIAYVLFN